MTSFVLRRVVILVHGKLEKQAWSIDMLIAVGVAKPMADCEDPCAAQALL